MAEPGSTIVVDIGKTLSKVTLWTRGGMLLAREVRANAGLEIDGLRRLDIDGIGGWLIETLGGMAGHGVDAIIPVGHGAGVVAIGPDGPLFAPLDYEQPIPPAVMSAYRGMRDPFAISGSPTLPDGLNLGSQLFWLNQLYPDAMARATLVPWAQYWAWFLSGRACTEVTSLGCHSDLWAPGDGCFSPMARRLGWADRFAPLAGAADRAGTLRPEIAAASGLPKTTAVHVGIHDSNAALLAARGFDAIAAADATVLSTGTWFIAMRRPADGTASPDLAEDRDTLVNVDAQGRPVPSGRFMGGREIEDVIGLDTRRVDIEPDQPRLLAAVPRLLADEVMLLPTLAPGCGPFPDHAAQWLGEPGDWYARRAAVCLYAALVADAMLDLIGSRDRLLVEGRFAQAQVFVAALAALRPDTEIYVANAHNDVSFGALRLIDPTLVPAGELRRVEPLGGGIERYRQTWHAAIANTGKTGIDKLEPAGD